MNGYISALVKHGIASGLIQPEDSLWAANRIAETMGLAGVEAAEAVDASLHAVLEALTENAVQWGLCDDNQVARDLFDTKLMGQITPMPHEVRSTFFRLYGENPQKATDWFYRFSCDTNYIRRDRIEKDEKWVYSGDYGDLDITINLSKPEKDPKAIAAAKNAPQVGYPKCLLCPENEGYAGHMNHPARQNHRIIPVKINGTDWFMQYSPYVYYNEHCIVFNALHTPMAINGDTFRKLLDFVEQFPHYFVGSNADLPIVGGSILSHDHFQGGHYTFAMERAEAELPLQFKGFEEVDACIVRWPMSVIRLRCPDKQRLVELGEKILAAWRGYTDEAAFVFAETRGVPHNTITPIARRKDGDFELDLVLRNNITTEQHPMGVYHPHEKLHHIKKENIGLIEVMGLAVLPSRLKGELAALADAILAGREIAADPVLEKHAVWVEELKKQYVFSPENAQEILRKEVGKVFQQVLEDAGVYKCTAEGRAAFLRFVDAVNG